MCWEHYVETCNQVCLLPSWLPGSCDPPDSCRHGKRIHCEVALTQASALPHLGPFSTLTYPPHCRLVGEQGNSPHVPSPSLKGLLTSKCMRSPSSHWVSEDTSGFKLFRSRSYQETMGNGHLGVIRECPSPHFAKPK